MRLYRMQELKDYIQQHEKASIDELCQAMGVSKSTLRRDLDLLAGEGWIEKVYGGVKYRDSSQLIPYENRGVLNAEAKRAIGRRAGELVEEGDVLFLDSGTTTPYMLESLSGKHVTVLTHSISVINAAGALPDVALFALPGLYYPKTKSFRCMDTVAFLRKYNITKAFMAASGFSRSGVTNSATWEYDIKQYVAHNAQKVYLCIDSAKFGVTRMMTYCEAEQLTGIVCEAAPGEEWLEYLEEKGVQLIL